MRHMLERRLQAHFFALMRRKTVIETEISEELKRPLPCWMTLQTLKRKRLRLKERLQSIAMNTQPA
ncbi:MAG: DUF465 domain-containing protein [Hyphomicrobiaceae bacterium]